LPPPYDRPEASVEDDELDEDAAADDDAVDREREE